ncbi:hypothetical protein HWV62_44917 [Athelia sp. TMB]|nr:hypothetical protein HWV62_44917 [Athelia sp. TMB]
MVASVYSEQLQPLSLELQEMHKARETLFIPLHFAKLETATRIVQDEYNTIFNKTSAIHKLPNEILATIFEAAHHGQNGLELQLSRVTRRWRAVTINTPRMWCKIDLRVDGILKVRLLALYLSRSKAVPFRLMVTERLDDEEYEDILGRLLGDHIHRCRHLAFNFRSIESAAIILDYLAVASAPILKLFDVGVYPPIGVQQSSVLFTGGAPMLSVVRLRGLASYIPPLQFITVLHVDHFEAGTGLEIQKWRDMLSPLTRLVSLVIKGGVITEFWEPEPLVKLPALRTLQIEESGQGQLQYLYHIIDAPLLECFSLAVYMERDPWYFGTTKFPTVHTLTLTLATINHTEQQLFASMQAFPNVHTVSFKRQDWSEFNTMLRLLLKADPQCLHWPRLRHFASTVMLFNRDHVTPKLLNECLTSRINMGRPIETLTLVKHVIDELSTDHDGLPPQKAWKDLVQVIEYRIGREACQVVAEGEENEY